MRVHVPPIKAVQNDVTVFRALVTIYQNTTGRPLVCQVSCDVETINNGEQALIFAFTGPASPPAVGVAEAGIVFGPARANSLNLSFIVPPGYYYRVIESYTGSAFGSLYRWIEIEL